MTSYRQGRQKYYDLFSRFYDTFIKIHARRDEQDTRHFLVEAAELSNKGGARVLDVCCGTGSVLAAFGEASRRTIFFGLDFSRGMLLQARKKSFSAEVNFVQADAAQLPFRDDSMDVVTCSHALYELKGEARDKALREMARVVKPEGVVLVMEHEVPAKRVQKLLFYARIASMGSKDAREFATGDLTPFKEVFSSVELSHSPSGRSRLVRCRMR
ncbi:MAG: methyltransferase domain-containing protein [Deltaproteobacteria bacterium]|nr:methyltransferase domain-containing protein [Deltaproteobacteria bacterium]MBW2071076.1 methyltransferase domain-containing protein [Deltaproteobacteria bacterium]